MSAQDAFRALPPELRAMALVGHYLQSFALMESALHELIGTALKLDNLQRLVVCKNLQLRDKIKIARTLLSLTFAVAEEQRSGDKVLDAIGSASNTRNMFAHDMFLPCAKTDGVEFLVIKATGKLQFPANQLSVDEVERLSEELLELREKLLKMRRLFEGHQLIKELLANPEALAQVVGDLPTTWLYEPDQADQGVPQPPSDPDYPPQEPTPATSPRTEK